MKEKKCLVISSGGLSGLTFLGLLQRIDVSHVTHFYGTSIGALICCLLAIGLGPMRIFFEICRQQNPFPQNWDKVMFDAEMAISSFARFEHELCGLMSREIGFVPTFEELAVRGVYLHVYAFSTLKYKTVEFSAAKTPRVSVIDAVLASSSIPLIFPPRKIGADSLIDGAFLCPLPLKYAQRQHKPERIIVIFTEPYKWGEYKRFPRFSLLFNILTLSLVYSHQKAVRKCSAEMEVYNVKKCDHFVLNDLKLEEKWALFTEGFVHKN